MTAQTILPANSVVDTGFNVDNSLRFRGATANTYLTATFGSAPTLATKNTISLWFKRSLIDATQQLYATNNNAANIILNRSGASTGPTAAFYTNSGQLLGPRLYRDTSAWMHFVFAFDSTQGTEANRFKVYINGVEETSFDNTAYPAQEASQLGVNGQEIQIGTRANYDRIFDGYMAETAFVDGQALNATSFGEFDEDSGIWKPIDISGLTFGNNGFYLEYKGTGTSANSSGIGADTSGNDLHFAVNAFTAADQSTDTCTNNFCTLNPLINIEGSYTLSEGNTEFLGTAGNDATFGTLSVQGSGKWYFEAEFDTNSSVSYAGFADVELVNNIGTGNPISSFIGMYRDDHTIQIGGSSEGAYTDVSDGDIFGFAMNLDAASGSRTVIVQKNGSTIDTVTIPTANENNAFIPVVGDTSTSDGKLKTNFGGTPNPTPSSAVSDAKGFGAFEYSPTIGGVAYLALCTKNLASNG